MLAVKNFNRQLKSYETTTLSLSRFESFSAGHTMHKEMKNLYCTNAIIDIVLRLRQS